MKINLVSLVILGILFISFASAAVFNNPSAPSFSGATSTNSVQSAQPNFNNYYTSEQVSTYWPILADMQKGICTASTDFIISIAPGGCTPMVVRSDLLEEQNVPVFCQISAIRINPLIKIASIRSISFKGQYPEGVAGISFHPAQAAIRSYNTLLGNPALNNIGYVVIVLKKNAVEKKMPEWISGNLTATIYYDPETIYGTNAAEFYSPVTQTEDEWEEVYSDYRFWSGNFLRVSDVDNNSAKIEIYAGDGEQIAPYYPVSVTKEIILNKGQTSEVIYLPGFYCKAGLQLRFNGLVSADDSAKLNINGDTIWVRKGSTILNGKCTVTKVNAISDSGSVEISCPGQKIVLMLQKKGANISIGDNAAQYSVGQVVGTTGYYLVYSGVVPSKVSDAAGKNFVVLYKTTDGKEPKTEIYTQVTSKLSNVLDNKVRATDYTLKNFKEELGGSGGLFGSSAYLVVVQDNPVDIQLAKDSKISIKLSQSDKETNEEIYSDKSAVGVLVEDYFAKTDASAQYLLDNLPQEKIVDGDESNLFGTYGEKALWSEIELAENLGKQQTEQNLLQNFISIYPNSNKIAEAMQKLAKSQDYDLSRASASAYINNNYHYIGLDSIQQADKSSKTARVSVSGVATKDVHEGDFIYTNGLDKKKDYIFVEKIDVNSVSLVYHAVSNNGDRADSMIKLGEDETSVKQNRPQITVTDINVKSFAYVSLIPHVDTTKTEASFSFKIGIEKRAIQLSPDKTKDMIANLNKTIDSWENINKKLGNLVSAWKGVCFATSAVMMLKSFASGLDGKSMARQEVMKTYRTICSTDPQYKGMSKTECYNKLSKNINADVDARAASIEKTNNLLKQYDQAHIISKGSLLESDVTNDSAVKQDMRNWIKQNIGDPINIGTAENPQNVPVDSIDDYESLRELIAQKQSSGLSDAFKNDQQARINSLLQPTYQRASAEAGYNLIRQSVPEAFGVSSPLTNGQTMVQYSGKSLTKAEMEKYLVDSDSGNKNLNNILSNFGSGNNQKMGAEVVPIGGKLYFVPLIASSKSDSSEMVQRGVYEVESTGDGKLKIINEVPQLPQAPRISFVNTGNNRCSNTYTSPKAKYYQSTPDKALPAIVPFDTKNGWYAKTNQGIGGLGSATEKSYQASGAVSFFYICNVGADHLQETSDDICQSFDINTYNNVKSFSGCPTLTGNDVSSLAQKAQQAIRDAASQQGKSSIRVNGVNIDAELSASNEGLMECQDFMSPEDCMILFNVCDPVICPTSRCDLGGKYKVANVAQSGIIGSILLCLPNFKQGIMVPVCLTGIHAGIESLISILKSERDCLKKSLETGQHVGICDEITSIYLCEFFWREMAPLVNILIPKMIEASYGQGVRGGGEYMTVMNSWDTLQNNIAYFQGNYAKNSFDAYNLRSIETAGGTFCKAFIGTSVPNIKTLLEPDSPSQFYAQFSEVVFTEATVPATSQYKVYYHIYAGKDIGAQYIVYLKNPPASGYYNQNQQVVVRSGYIARGEQDDQAIDFTAPAGYKELCVVINADEKCGFKSVSTDFAVNYIKDKYTEEQANKKDITKESECISGSPSLLPMANLNLQAGAEASVNPQIAMNGIVRVCATNNPGASVYGSSSSSGSFTGAGTGGFGNGVTGNVVASGVNAISGAAPNAEITDANTGASGTSGTFTTTSTPPTTVDVTNANVYSKNNVSSRWTDVGYCGTPSMRCWLDTDSVKDEVSRVQAVDGTISGMTGNMNLLDSENNTMTEEQTGAVLSNVSRVFEKTNGMTKLRSDINKALTGMSASDSVAISNSIESILGTDNKGGIIFQLNNVGGTRDNYARGATNKRIAEALEMKVEVYKIVVEALKAKYFPKISVAAAIGEGDNTLNNNYNAVSNGKWIDGDKVTIGTDVWTKGADGYWTSPTANSGELKWTDSLIQDKLNVNSFADEPDVVDSVVIDSNGMKWTRLENSPDSTAHWENTNGDLSSWYDLKNPTTSSGSTSSETASETISTTTEDRNQIFYYTVPSDAVALKEEVIYFRFYEARIFNIGDGQGWKSMWKYTISTPTSSDSSAWPNEWENVNDAFASKIGLNALAKEIIFDNFPLNDFEKGAEVLNNDRRKSQNTLSGGADASGTISTSSTTSSSTPPSTATQSSTVFITFQYADGRGGQANGGKEDKYKFENNKWYIFNWGSSNQWNDVKSIGLKLGNENLDGGILTITSVTSPGDKMIVQFGETGSPKNFVRGTQNNLHGDAMNLINALPPTPKKYANVNQIELWYTEGFDDEFFFRWNSNTNKPEVIMMLNTVGIGRGTTYPWTSDIWAAGREQFTETRDVYEYEKTDISNLMNSKSWDDLIDSAKLIREGNSKNIQIKIYEGSDKGYVEN